MCKRNKGKVIREIIAEKCSLYIRNYEEKGKFFVSKREKYTIGKKLTYFPYGSIMQPLNTEEIGENGNFL